MCRIAFDKHIRKFSFQARDDDEEGSEREEKIMSGEAACITGPLKKINIRME